MDNETSPRRVGGPMASGPERGPGRVLAQRLHKRGGPQRSGGARRPRAGRGSKPVGAAANITTFAPFVP
ncbi:unnamed protein product, partial [Iphiclides podalirius]